MHRRVLITGHSTSGKTFLAEYFKAHGKNAIDADISGIGIWLNKKHKAIKPPAHLGRKINQWAEKNQLTWAWDEKKVKALISQNKDVYLFGGASNKYDFLKLFDKVYYLETNHKLIRKRLESRFKNKTRYHDFGRTKAQKEYIIKTLALSIEKARKAGCEFIDAALTPKQIFNIICPNGE